MQIFEIVLISVLIWYLSGLYLTFKKNGFDPSLITLISPFYIFDFRILKYYNFLYLLPALVGSLSSLIFLFIACQIILLILFNRTSTQPIEIYLLNLIEAAFFYIFSSDKIILILVVLLAIIINIIGLKVWKNKLRLPRYNNWVYHKTISINKRFFHKSLSLSRQEWFYALHFAVTEDIARPAIVRLVERIYFKVKKPAAITSGIMQVKANRLLSDTESVAKGAKIIQKAIKSVPGLLNKDQYFIYSYLTQTYNGSQNPKVNAQYVGFLSSTLEGVKKAWSKINESS